MTKSWWIKVPASKYEWWYDLIITKKHKIRQCIWLTGSMMKDGKEYWFYWVMKEKYGKWDRVHNRILKILTPVLNNII